ncbi:glycosyltransferase family 1 protein [Bifidobacterium pseudolongum]|uniref:glycosyltransferase family 1 protein n=1 Tax=Bifidobacterium pseudolongum TaxID=1694 RepID=UPI0010E65AAC|nr:glycosyltransferase family 1 protein [Bifidobacterium pseudolongum]RYQ70483.1 capsular polysaccharide biosynthesis protein Cps4H [Bifidobacterium pseudolongum subsp. globosum]
MSNDKIRVVQVVGRMNGGGVESTIMSHFRFIDRDRFHFDFVANADSTHIPYAEIEELGGTVHTVHPYRSFGKYNQDCMQLFEELHPLIVHANVNALSVFPLHAAKQEHVPIRIAHSHSTASPKEVAKTVVKDVLRPCSRMFPTHLAACGELSARWLFGNATVDSGRVKMIRNAVDLERFSVDEDMRWRIREELGVGDAFVIGQIGRLCYQKNQEFSLRVFAELLKIHKNAVLVLVGGGDERKQLEQEARSLGVFDRVKFLGIRKDVPALYNAFDVMIFPSRYEGLPVSLIEAQACGCPSLISDAVTKEVQIVPGMIESLPLNAGVTMWAKTLLALGLRTRDARSAGGRFLKNAGYDIRDSSKDLGDWYESLIQNIAK